MCAKRAEASVGEAVNLRLASPYRLHGVGPIYTWRLAMSGVLTLEQLVAPRSLQELANSSGIPLELLGRFQLGARAVLGNEVYMVAPFELPSERLIYLDIETDVRGRRVWLIGLLVDDEFIQLYAEDWGHERDILEEFSETIHGRPGHVLVSYSGTGFDVRVMLKALRRHGLETVCLSSIRHVDLCCLLRRCFIFPNQSFALKDLGSYLGYPFRNPGLDGLKVANLYTRHAEEGEELDHKVLEYNEDDVRALPYIVDWAIQEQAVHTSLVHAHEREEVNQVIWERR